MASREVGRVVGLWRYPVKSMAGEPLDDVEVAWHGLAGDRRWAFVQDRLVRSGFPYLTIRERAVMGHHRAAFVEPTRPDTSPVSVRTPDGDELDVADPALAEALGGGVRPLKLDRGTFDVLPLSLITTQTIAALSTLVGRELEVERFRPNLVVAATGDDPWPEDGWVGRTLRIGGLSLRADQRDQRCVLVNVDPRTTERDPSVLRTIAQERQARLGVYGTTVTPGRVAVGDPVELAG